MLKIRCKNVKKFVIMQNIYEIFNTEATTLIPLIYTISHKIYCDTAVYDLIGRKTSHFMNFGYRVLMF